MPSPEFGEGAVASRNFSIDSFQGAFSGFLAHTVSLDQLRRVVVKCVVEDIRLSQIIGKSFASALRANCLPRTDYWALIAELAKLPQVARKPAASRRAGGYPAGSGRLLCGRFEIHDHIAAGGIGVLYRAIDRYRRDAGEAKSAVAVKMLGEEFRHCPDALRSLQCEVRNAKRLAHPNIRAVYELDRCATDFFITMEWLDGESLARRLDRTGSRAMPWPAARLILTGVGAGLTHAHERGIVHGDVKPANVFVTVDGHVKLLDFGQAYAIDAQYRPVGKLAISPAYASCEVHEGACPEEADDVFSLAVMAYRMLAGARPFGRYTPLKAEQAGIRSLRPMGIDARQWRALQQGLAWRREQRPATVEEFLAGLMPRPAPWQRPRKDAIHAAA